MNAEICYDWLTVFFLHEDYELTDESDTILEEMKTAGAGTNNAVFLIRDSVTHKTASDGSGINVFHLSVSRLTKDADTGKLSFIRQPVKINNADRNCWKEAFRYIFSTVKSKRQILISFSHGAAFGINFDIDQDDRPGGSGQASGGGASPAVSAGKKVFKVQRNPYFYLDQEDIKQIKAMPQWTSMKEDVAAAVESGKVPADDAKNFCRQLEMVWISDLADTLEEVTGGKKLDLLILNNCYMLSFDACYLLRDQVDYILGTEGSLDAIGYGYQAMLDTINATPGTEPLGLAKQAIGDYVALYTSRGSTDELSTQAIQVIATAVFAKALELFDQFLGILEKNLSEIKADLTTIRETEMEYVCITIGKDEAHLLLTVDAFLWVELVFQRCAALFAGTGLPEAFERLKTEMVKASYKGSFLVEWDQRHKNQYGYQGISIFFPNAADYNALTTPTSLNATPWCLYFGNQLPSKWEDSWRHFLGMFYGVG